MTLESFKRQIEFTLRVNNQKVINANCYEEQEFHRSYGITLRAAISVALRLSLQFPELAKQYYDSLPKATMD